MGSAEAGSSLQASQAMPTGVHDYRVCGIEDVPQGGMLRVPLGAREALAVFRVDDRFFVVDDRCPHRGASLAKYGELASGTVECILHGAVFDLETGDCVDGPCSVPLDVHASTERDGAIYIAR